MQAMTSLVMIVSMLFYSGVPLGTCFIPEPKVDNDGPIWTDLGSVPGGLTSGLGGRFIENKGQFPSEVLFVADTDFGRVGIGQGKIFYDIVSEVVLDRETSSMKMDPMMNLDNEPVIKGAKGNVVIYDLEGSSDTIPVGVDPIPGVSNYLYGNDRNNWVKGARHFSSVVFEDAWSGIDMKYYFNEGSLKYDLILEPGADPDDIRIGIEGSESFSISERELNLDLGDGRKVSDGGLVTFESGPSLRKVDSTFRKMDANTFGFEIIEYDTSKAYIIDPEVDFCIKFGGSAAEYAYDIQAGPDGNIYLSGQTKSSDFITTPGAYDTTYQDASGTLYGDAFVSCIEPTSMTLVFSTYLGGTGDENDFAYHQNIKDTGEILIYGVTYSSDFPTTPDAYQTSFSGSGTNFILQLTSDGDDLYFSTFFGSNWAFPKGMTYDDEDNVIIYGWFSATNSVPYTDGAYDTSKDGWSDGFIAKFDPDCSDLLACTGLGGGDDDQVNGLLIDEEGNYLVSGFTRSSDFPTTEGAYSRSHSGGMDVFIASLDPDLTSLISGTYFGGDITDNSLSMSFDTDGSIVLTGYTNSTNLPITSGTLQDDNAGGTDVLFLKFEADLSDVIAVAVLGGTGYDIGEQMVLDSYGNLIVAGRVGSDDFPITDDAYQEEYPDGVYDMFLSIVDPSLSTLDYSTYLGGNSNEYTGGICISGEGMVYLCGWTQSMDFPVTDDPFEAGGDWDGFIFAIPAPGGAGGGRQEPLDVTSLKTYSDPDFVNESTIFDFGETIYVKAEGIDANASMKDGLRVNITLDKTGTKEIKLYLRETDLNSGVYTGKYKVPGTVQFFENITFYAVMDPSKRVTAIIDTPIRLAGSVDSITITEHQSFDISFENIGWFQDPVWTFTTDRDWVQFDLENRTIYGTPTNPDVGRTYVRINIDDAIGHQDEQVVKIEVKNIPPNITTENVLVAFDSIPYSVDYSSDEDGEEGIVWKLGTNATWFGIDSKNGILNGTPGNDDIGWFWVYVEVDDGNGGVDRTNFNITVFDTNERPTIVTEDITSVNQGDRYLRNYIAEDPDPGDSLTWHLDSDATWLSINEKTGTLSGTPGPLDVGTFDVNVSVMDKGGLSDWHQFQLTVIDKNDPPFFTDVPGNVTIYAGTTYSFDIQGSDHDPGSVLTYSIRSTPTSDITIDKDTGSIEWLGKIKWFTEKPYILKVEVTISDGKLNSKYEFRIELLTTTPPTVTLLSPESGKRASSAAPRLSWSGQDQENEPLTYDLYISDSEAFVTVRKAEVRYIADYPGTSIEVTGLNQGVKYYWTVAPFDGGSFGTCTNGVFSFTLNSPPKIKDIDNQEAIVGRTFSFAVTVTDDDEGDRQNLRYFIEDGPEGMTIGERSGIIKWTPHADQDILVTVFVNVTDGIDHSITSFVIELRADSGGSSMSMVPILVGAILVLIGIGVGLFFLIRKKGNKKENTEGEGEPEEQVFGSHIDEDRVAPVVQTDVPLSPTEAHAHLGKGSKKVSYEDLYGAPAPKVEESTDMTTRELKEYISGQIKELEGMEVSEE